MDLERKVVRPPFIEETIPKRLCVFASCGKLTQGSLSQLTFVLEYNSEKEIMLTRIAIFIHTNSLAYIQFCKFFGFGLFTEILK